MLTPTNQSLGSCSQVIGLACSAAFGLTVIGGAALAQDPLQTINIAQGVSATQSSTFIAEERGIAKDAGITIKRHVTRTPSDSLANMLSGRSDLSIINVGSIAQAIMQNMPIKISAPVVYATSEIGIWVRADSPIKTVADLKGKTISLAQLQNNVHGYVLKQLDDAGVDLNSVKFTLVPTANALGVLRAGTVDAAQINEPFIADAGNTIRPIMKNLSGDKWLVSYFVTTQKFATEQAALLKRFEDVMAKTTDFVQKNPEELRKDIGRFVGLSGPNLVNMTLPKFDSDPATALADAKSQLQVMVKYKIIPSAPDLTTHFR